MFPPVLCQIERVRDHHTNTMTMTPNTVSELLELNKSENNKWEEISTLLEDFNPVETLELIQLLTQKMTIFHFEVVRNHSDDMDDQVKQIWIHDGTVLGQMLTLMNNMSDFNEEEED